MAKQIIHGIGKAILRDFKAPKTIIGFADLQDLSVESTFSEEDISGGNRMFPIASFKTDQALNVSATSATFNAEMLEYLDGATKSTGAKPMTGFMEVAIPADGTVTLPADKTPIADSVTVKGFTVGTATPVAGTFYHTGTDVDFNVADAGEIVQIVFEYNTSANGVEYAVTEKSLSKPFIFDYIFPIYDEDSQISHEGMIKIFKAKSTSGFSLSAQHKGLFSPQFDAKAQDPQRVDGKLWTFTVDGVTVV